MWQYTLRCHVCPISLSILRLMSDDDKQRFLSSANAFFYCSLARIQSAVCTIAHIKAYVFAFLTYTNKVAFKPWFMLDYELF